MRKINRRRSDSDDDISGRLSVKIIFKNWERKFWEGKSKNFKGG
ncbi:MAG: hypothetical protein ACQEQD_07040 [Bacillota bacterium]